MTNIIEQLGGQEAMEGVAKNLMGEYGWLFICAFLALMGKDLLMNFVQGMMVFWSSSWRNDEILFLHGRQARVIRKGCLNTTFQMADRGTALIIPNSQLKHLTVERRLPNGCEPDYLPKGSEQMGPMEVSIVDKPKAKPAARGRRK